MFHKKNGGLCSARNHGLERATGEWVLFVDSDDWCACNYIEKLVSSIKDETIDVVISSAYEQNKDLSFRLLFGTFIKEGVYDDMEDLEIAHALSIGNMSVWKNRIKDYVDDMGGNGAPWNKLYKMQIIKDHSLKFDEKTSVMEDLLFNLHYFQYVKKIAVVDGRGYYYRYVNSGITKKMQKDRLRKEYYFLSQIEDYCNQLSENKILLIAVQQRVCILMRRLVRYVVDTRIEMSPQEQRIQVQNYLNIPIISDSLKKIRIKDVKGNITMVAVLLAKKQMVNGMYILGKIYSFIR